MKVLFKLKSIKCLLIASSLVLLAIFLLAQSSIAPSNSQNHYEFPLTKTSVEKALAEVGLDWKITDQDSIDESNMNFFLSNVEGENTLIISSMKKQGMLSLGISPRRSREYETDILDDEKLKQLLHLACEFTGIGKHNSIYGEFDRYITDRDSWKYGNTIWYYKDKDKVLEIQLKPSSLYKGKYQIGYIHVKNLVFFKELKKIWTNNTTQKYQKDGISVYTDVSLKEINKDISKNNKSISRIVIEGNITNTRTAKVNELEKLTLDDSKYSLYPEDYHFATIGDGTDTIEVLLPTYIVDLSLHNDGKKEWHITYYPSSGIYVVDFGVDI